MKQADARVLLAAATGSILAWSGTVSGAAPAAPAGPGGPEGPAAIVAADPDTAIRDVMDLGAYSLQDLLVPGALEGDFTFEVELGGAVYTIEARPHSVRADDFQVLVQGEDGMLTGVQAPAITTFRGHVADDPFSTVRGSIKPNGVDAVITLGDDSVWGVQPMADAVEGAPAGRHVVYRYEDITPPEGVCGFENPDTTALPDNGGGTTRGTGLDVCEVAFDADREYFLVRGGVTNTVNDIESIMNLVESVYEATVDITFEITTIVVRTVEPDPYSTTSPGGLLTQFINEWNDAAYNGVRRDVAHLMTGKNIQNNVLGIAVGSTTCDLNDAYALSWSSYTGNTTLRRSLTAHEIGHNFSAIHCDGDSDCRIMCSGNGGCLTPSTFGSRAISDIGFYKNFVSCLEPLPDPNPAPFFEPFPDAAVDNQRWTWRDGALAFPFGSGMPSSPNVLMLSASGPDAFDQHEIRSGFIQVSGVSDPVLGYWVAESDGLSGGEELVVEVWQSNQRWTEVNRITASGASGQPYFEYSHPLSGSSVHNEFRVRFRVEGASSSSNRFLVDDVYVGPAAPPTQGACCLADGTCNLVPNESNCTFLGGTYLGDDTTCDVGVCAPSEGPCCMFVPGLAPDCFITDETDCIASGGTFSGGMDCSDCTDFCACDWDASEVVNSGDFFGFIGDFLAGDADFDNNGGTDSGDFFGFIGCFLDPGGNGC